MKTQTQLSAVMSRASNGLVFRICSAHKDCQDTGLRGCPGMSGDLQTFGEVRISPRNPADATAKAGRRKALATAATEAAFSHPRGCGHFVGLTQKV